MGWLDRLAAAMFAAGPCSQGLHEFPRDVEMRGTVEAECKRCGKVVSVNTDDCASGKDWKKA